MSNYQTGRRKNDGDTRKTNDMMVNRMMALFVVAIFYIVGLLLLKKNGTSFETSFVLHVLPVVKLVTGLLFAATVGYFIYNRKKSVDESSRFITSTHLVMLAFVLFASAMLYSYVGNIGIVVGVIALLVAAFVYCFYQKEFFAYTIFTLVTSLGLYGIKGGYSASIVKTIVSIILTVVAFAAPILTVVIMTKVKKNDGKLKLRGGKLELMKKDSSYLPFYIGAIFALVAAVVGLIFNSIAFYAIIAFLFLYLVFAIVYTVKMI